MRLDFRLLVVDDDPTIRKGRAVKGLAKYLRKQGFTLDQKMPDDLSAETLRRLANRGGREFDLVMVDYNLGQVHKGTEVLRWFRSEMKYTETVFYTAGADANLWNEVARARIGGVFVTTRDDLDDVLLGLADTVIGKVVDITHTRGIAMAEVADIDTLMDATIRGTLESGKKSEPQEAIRKLCRTLMSGNDKKLQKLSKKLHANDFLGIVKDRFLFTSNWKYRGILELAKCSRAVPAKDLAVVKHYGTKILDKRNLLAHVQEEIGDDGRVILRSIGGGRESGKEIDDEWMGTFRQDLAQHTAAMHNVCRAIDSDFSLRSTGEVKKSAP